MISEREEIIAKTLFNWLNQSEGAGDHQRAQPPYTYNADAERLNIGVDGQLDCRLIAKAIYSELIFTIQDNIRIEES